MKKIIILLSLAFIFNSCDDGDLIVENFNFSDSVIQRCSESSDIYLKTKGSELLLAVIPNEFMIDEATEVGAPRIYTINTNDQIIYRKYSGEVGINSICSSIPPASPNVIEEFKALPGATIEVTTTVTPDVNETTLATTINYNHQITFRNVLFSNNTSTLNYLEYNYGTFKSTTNSLPFNLTNSIAQSCSETVIYKRTANQALVLDFDSDYYTNNVGSQTINLSATNQIICKLYNDDVDGTTICSSATPAPTSLIEEWVADEGQVTIITTEILDTNNTIIGYNYAITLNNIVYKKGENSFTHPFYNFGNYEVL